MSRNIRSQDVAFWGDFTWKLQCTTNLGNRIEFVTSFLHGRELLCLVLFHLLGYSNKTKKKTNDIILSILLYV